GCEVSCRIRSSSSRATAGSMVEIWWRAIAASAWPRATFASRGACGAAGGGVGMSLAMGLPPYRVRGRERVVVADGLVRQGLRERGRGAAQLLPERRTGGRDDGREGVEVLSDRQERVVVRQAEGALDLKPDLRRHTLPDVLRGQVRDAAGE